MYLIPNSEKTETLMTITKLELEGVRKVFKNREEARI